MYNECLSEIDDEIKLISSEKSLKKNYNIEYEYVEKEDRILNNEYNNIINILKYK